MKNLQLPLFIFSLVIFFFSSCKEEPPYINYTPPQSVYDSTYLTITIPSAQLKEVLIEDASGASCGNCPAAAQVAVGVVASNPTRTINVATIYPNLPFGGLTSPVNKPNALSKFDFRTDIGTDIVNYVTVPPSLPSGYIDRNKITGNADWYIPYTSWSSVVSTELLITTPVNIDLESHYNSSDNKLTVALTITYTQADSGNNFINVMILQDSIIDAQENKDGSGTFIYDSAYTHNHTLMDMLTAHTGDLLNRTGVADRTLIPGRVFKIGYEKTLGMRNNSPSTYPQPPWNPKHLSILAFVTRDLPTKYVLQSKKVEVQ